MIGAIAQLCIAVSSALAGQNVPSDSATESARFKAGPGANCGGA